jgi:glycosyltransferase involved in cell wall biosynthesis
LRRLVLKTVDAVAVEGKPQYRFVKNFNIPAGKVFIANHCSLDYSLFKSRSLKKEYGINEYLVVLYLGRIVQNKGLDVLIRAFSRIEKERDGIFLIVGGDGFLRPRCERLANELSVKHILFLGAIHGEETVASWYKSADIFVMPSLIGTYERLWVEGWGLAINEAMSMGKPVITTDAVGAAIDLVKNNINGYIVKQGDVDDLYLALKRIIDDPEKREAMGRNSRRIFEDFNDFDKMFSGFQAAIQYVTARPSIRRKTKGQDST